MKVKQSLELAHDVGNSPVFWQKFIKKGFEMLKLNHKGSRITLTMWLIRLRTSGQLNST